MAAAAKAAGKAAEKTVEAAEKAATKVAYTASDVAEDVTHEVVEAAGHVKPGGFNLNGTTKGQQFIIIGGAVLLGAGVGGFGVYHFTKKHLEMRYRIIADKEIADAKSFYSRLHKTDENDETVSPQQLLEDKLGKDAADALRGYSGNTVPTVDGPYASEAELADIQEARRQAREGKGEVVEGAAPITVTDRDGKVVSHNIFDDAEPDGDVWDYEQELKLREANPTKPYIISKEEFLEGESGYEQADMVYFAGDQVLSDDQQIPVNDTDGLVGDANLENFGHGSGDAKMLYIRNDNTEMEYEIALSSGEYTREVLGLVEVDQDDKELKHSYSRTRKFRERDFE